VSELASGLARGELVETTIEKGVYRGRGLGRVGGRVVFVPRAFPGDRVLVRITEVHAGWAEGGVVELLETSPDRRVSPCPYVPRCGGCAYQDLGYEAQLRLKESVLRESLARAGAGWQGPVTVHPSPERGWRMRASLHFASGDEGLRLGLRQEGTRRVVDVESCLQLSDAMNGAARAMREALASRPALARQARGLDLLEAPEGGALVAVLEMALPPAEAHSLAGLAKRVPGLTGFGVRAGRRLHWLDGTPHVEASVLGATLRAHVGSFFQANRFLLEPLVRAVVDLVPGDGRVLDLYAGVGLFALPLSARSGAEVLAVEVSPSAVSDLRANARRNGLERVRVLPGDVREVLAAARPEPGERVVLDPPRTGAGPEVVDLLASRAPAVIVYVSCDPATLGRDLARLAGRGYRPDAVHLFDLFPDTFHLEAVVRLRPAAEAGL
jgi:23S rRNA (uracil1939-C5)-methyltransferase